MPEHFITTRSVMFHHREKVEAQLILWGATDIRHIAAHGVIEWVFHCTRVSESEYRAFVARLNGLQDIEVTDQTFYKTRHQPTLTKVRMK